MSLTKNERPKNNKIEAFNKEYRFGNMLSMGKINLSSKPCKINQKIQFEMLPNHKLFKEK